MFETIMCGNSVAPVTGVVSAIHHVPGDTVRPGDVLFSLELLSESLRLTQTDLFKTAEEIKLTQAQRMRLAGAGGAEAPPLVDSTIAPISCRILGRRRRRDP